MTKQKQTMKIIDIQEKTALVEMGLRRVFVPAASVTDGVVSPDDISAGLPASFDPNFSMPSSDDLIQALRRRNLWTAEDITRNSGLAREAVLEVFAGVFTQLFQAAQMEVKKHG